MATSTTDLSATLAARIVHLQQDFMGRAREHVNRVIELTHKIFSGEVKCEEQEDVEVFGDRHYVLRVMDSSTLEAVVAKHNQWHQKIIELPAGVRTCFRLAIESR